MRGVSVNVVSGKVLHLGVNCQTDTFCQSRTRQWDRKQDAQWPTKRCFLLVKVTLQREGGIFLFKNKIVTEITAKNRIFKMFYLPTEQSLQTADVPGCARADRMARLVSSRCREVALMARGAELRFKSKSHVDKLSRFILEPLQLSARWLLVCRVTGFYLHSLSLL